MHKNQFFFFTILVTLFLVGCSSNENDPILIQTKCPIGQGFDKSGTCTNCPTDYEVNSSGYCVEASIEEVNNTEKNSSAISEILQTVNISGKAIDGYIQNGTVELLNSNSIVVAKTQTDENGSWKISINDLNKSINLNNYVIKVSKGIDSETDNNFTGELSYKISSTDLKQIIVNPYSTLAKYSNQSNSIDKIAQILGLNATLVKQDYIEAYSKDKNNSELLKVAIQGNLIMVSLDIFAKNINDNNISYSKAFELIASALVTELLSKNSITRIDEIFETDSFLNRLFENQTTKSLKLLSKDDLKTVAKSTKTLNLIVQNFLKLVANENYSIANYQTSISAIATFINNNLKNSEINNFINAISVMGFDNIINIVKNISQQVTDQSSIETKFYIDVNLLANELFNDEVINQYYEIFNLYKDINISFEQILNGSADLNLTVEQKNKIKTQKDKAKNYFNIDSIAGKVIKEIVSPKVSLSVNLESGVLNSNFIFTAKILNLNEINSGVSYSWFIDNEKISNSSSTFTTKFEKTGSHVVKVIVSSKGMNSSDEITIIVNDLISNETSSNYELDLSSDSVKNTIGKSFRFTAKTNLINPTFTWFVNDTVQSISGSIFDYSFSSVGNHKVKVIATFDNTTITKSIIVSVIDLPVTDVYNLSIINNKVLFTISGIDDLNRTANISNGIFETINYSAFTGSKLETVKNSDFVMSFEIDHSFDPGDEKMINLAIKIVDSQNRSLVAVIKNLRLFYSNNKLYIDANSNINTVRFVR